MDARGRSFRGHSVIPLRIRAAIIASERLGRHDPPLAWRLPRTAESLGGGAKTALRGVSRWDVETGPAPEEIRQAGPFVAILMLAVLEHLQEPRAALARAAALLSRKNLEAVGAAEGLRRALSRRFLFGFNETAPFAGNE